MELNKKLLHYTFDDEMSMRASAKNWEYGTIYRLLPDTLKGEHRVLLFPHIQLSFTYSQGGDLRKVYSPEGKISVAAIMKSKTDGCFGYTKYRVGDVVIFDDTQPHIFFNASEYRIAIVSFSKNKFRKLSGKYGIYKEGIIAQAAPPLGSMLEEIFNTIIKNQNLLEDKTFEREQQERILAMLETLIEYNIPYIPKLTKGEKIALEIRDRVYHHIEPDITIKKFAESYGVTEQTLQNAFKSLFNMTPHKFLRNLKLNHVRRELLQVSSKDTTVVKIANRWGFTHMGHFSGYYTRLFGENPSVTLMRGITGKVLQEDIQKQA
jgi:AraC-like DNA-binding protein